MVERAKVSVSCPTQLPNFFLSASICACCGGPLEDHDMMTRERDELQGAIAELELRFGDVTNLQELMLDEDQSALNWKKEAMEEEGKKGILNELQWLGGRRLL
jgi:hypothetical protein